MEKDLDNLAVLELREKEFCLRFRVVPEEPVKILKLFKLQIFFGMGWRMGAEVDKMYIIHVMQS